MLANSRAPSSAQTGLHEDLARLLERRASRPFLKPFAEYNRRAFFESMERRTRAAPGNPLILDSCCGTGALAVAIAETFPECYVIGIDQSAARIGKSPRHLPPNLDLVRADLVDYWRLMRDAGVRLARHYLLYPNPWPKIGQLSRRWHAHPAFPPMLELGGRLECRSNWRIYIEEFCFSVRYLTGLDARCEAWRPIAAQTTFEKKYLESGHELFRTVVHLVGTDPENSG
ncbi:MAG: methyltransferase domain-containing protein [Candidatus Accumulibacter sp.]|nr:methyltransferase domain-containing protein [Accumulibacter sp.]